MVQLWYPAERPGGIFKKRKLACYRRREETSFVSSYQAALRTHSYLSAAILPGTGQGAPYPVLLFNPAWRGRRTQDTFLTEELASHGYVVAAIDHTYNSMPVAFPDGRVVVAEPIQRFELLVGTNPDEVRGIGNKEADKQALDVRFVLDELSRMNEEQGSRWFQTMDTENAGCCGHSLGGGVSVQAWATDARVRAAVNLDGWSFGSQVAKSTRAVEGKLPEHPLLFLYEDGYRPGILREASGAHGSWPREQLESTIDAMDYEHVSLLLRQYGGYWFKLKGANHATFTDRPITSPIGRLSWAAPIDARLAHGIVRALAVAFFDQALKGKPSRLLQEAQSVYRELAHDRPGIVADGTGQI
jgi:dienelactone hydrolase